MDRTLVVKQEAQEDMVDAYLYYEEQQEGLGERFLAEVNKRLDDLSTQPEYYGFIDDRKILRDVALIAFPYVLIYRIVASEVRVHAVFHTGKDPAGKYRG